MNVFSASKDDIIFSEGDKGGYMLILIDGKMMVSKSGDGGLHLLSYEGKGRVLGEMALIDHEPRSATCVASSDCDMVSLFHVRTGKIGCRSPSNCIQVDVCAGTSVVP